jgi:hypothetical protein
LVRPHPLKEDSFEASVQDSVDSKEQGVVAMNSKLAKDALADQSLHHDT